MQETLFKVRDLRKKDQFKLDDRYINGYAKVCGIYATAVYASLSRHAAFSTQECWPNIDLIAKQHNISRPSVTKGIKNLEEYNIIKVNRSRDEKGHKKNTYFLIDKSEWKPTQVNDVALENKTQGNVRTKPKATTLPIRVPRRKDPHHAEQSSANILHLQIIELFDLYKEVFTQKVSSTPPIFNWGMCEKLAKPWVKSLGLERMKELLTIYLSSDNKFFKENAYSLSCFLSTNILHRLNQNGHK